MFVISIFLNRNNILFHSRNSCNAPRKNIYMHIIKEETPKVIKYMTDVENHLKPQK